MICPFCKSLTNQSSWCKIRILKWVCSRPKGHKGPHVACLNTQHLHLQHSLNTPMKHHLIVKLLN